MKDTLALLRALAFLQSRSLVNSVRARLRRLRQPKYLIGAVVGAGYLYLWIGRAVLGGWRGGGRGVGGLPAGAPEALEAFAALILFVVMVGAWVFSGERASLRLSEAELNFLLPAPLSRRMLVRYRLVRAQVGTLVSALVLTLLTGRFARDGHAFVHMFAWWLVLTVVSLHALGASFAVQRLAEAGMASWLRRTVAVLVAGVVVGAVLLWLRSLPPPAPVSLEDPRGSVRDLGGWLRLAVNSGPAAWLFAPFRWLVKPWFAADLSAFARAVPPVLGLIGLHYWWIERSEVSFEEASLEAARQRAAARTAARAGRLREHRSPSRAVRPPFALAATGFPPVALLWKHLIRTRLTTRKVALGLGGVLLLATVLRQPFVPPQVAVGIAGFLQLGLIPLTLTGGAVTSLPFRRDLNDLDVLMGCPLPAWQVVLGQMAGGVAVMGTVQALVVLAAALCYRAGGPFGDLPPGLLAVAAVSALLVLLPLNVVNAFVPAAATLLFPSWMKSAQGAHGTGVEVVGQRLLIGVVQLLATAIAWLPAALVGAGGYLAGNALGGLPAGIVLAAACACAVLCVEAAVAVWLLGKILEKHDASEEQ